jgi:hypothetical protein
MEFIFERLRHKNEDGSIQIMYSIHGKGGDQLEELELTHLDGHKGSKPVRFAIPFFRSSAIQLKIFFLQNRKWRR